MSLPIEAIAAGTAGVVGAISGAWTAWAAAKREERKARLDTVVQIDTQQFRLIDQLSERIKVLEERVDDHGRQQLECERRDAENRVHIASLEREVDALKRQLGASPDVVP